MYELEGDPTPFLSEREDEFDTLDWIAGKDWYDGKIGMWGGSYFGYTQWAIANRIEGGLSAAFIYQSSTNFYDMFYEGGAFALKSALWWASTSAVKSFEHVTKELLARGVDGFPLIEADDRAVGNVQHFNDWVSHTERDEFWLHVDGQQRATSIAAPTYIMADWYDPVLLTSLKDYNHIQNSAASAVAGNSRLVIGPWAHATTVKIPSGTSEINFRLASILARFDWFDRHLRGKDIGHCPPIRIYVMGTDRWRDEKEWPPKRARSRNYYLHSGGSANTVNGDGLLSISKSTAPEPADRYEYDPRNPVPTLGGAMLGGGREGPVLQNANDHRADVLVYSTDPLEENTEVAGHVKANLYVKTDAPCTDFTAKLVDVCPDGSAYNICDSIIRTTFSGSGTEPTRIEIELGATSNLFKNGHCIRLLVSSSNYPRCDRNPNTGGAIPRETEPVKAEQAVHHGPDSASVSVPPIIPPAGSEHLN